MTTEEVNKIMELPEMQGAIMIGSEEDRETYFPAIVGIDKEKGRFKYDYNELCHCFAEEFRQADEEADNVEPGHDYETAGVEWVEYNVIRSLLKSFIRRKTSDNGFLHTGVLHTVAWVHSRHGNPGPQRPDLFGCVLPGVRRDHAAEAAYRDARTAGQERAEG